jgi:hypothetical protein
VPRGGREFPWRLSAVGCRLSAVGGRRSAVGCRLSAVGSGRAAAPPGIFFVLLAAEAILAAGASVSLALPGLRSRAVDASGNCREAWPVTGQIDRFGIGKLAADPRGALRLDRVATAVGSLTGWPERLRGTVRGLRA